MVSVTPSLPASLDGMVANVRQLCPHERIEFFEKLLRDCSFMEIRFIASLVENILSVNYGSLVSVEDELPLLLSNSEKLLAFGDKLHLDDQRRQLIVILCLLKSRERLEVTKIIAEIFQRLPDAVRKMSSSSSLTVLAAHEVLLLFSLAMCHPAFEFSQKYNIYTALQSVVDLLQPALGDGDKESCILLKSSFCDLVAPNLSATGNDKLDSAKAFKISQDEDIAFIQVDIPVTSSPNSVHTTQNRKSVTVKTEKLVNVYAEKCVQQPLNPKTDPNSVLLKAKDGSRESVLQSALNAIVSDGGLSKLLEIFPQDAKAQMAEERLRRTTGKLDMGDVGNSCSPDSDFITNENNSPDSTSAQSGLTSGSSASSLRGGFTKKLTKSEFTRSSASANGGINPSVSGVEQTRDARKLAPSAPPSLAADESPSSGVSSCDWNALSLSSKTSLGNYPRGEEIENTFNPKSSHSTNQAGFDLSDHTVPPSKSSGSRIPPNEFMHPMPQLHTADPKALAMYLQYAQAYQTAAMFGIPPPSAGPLIWPPHVLDVPHHSPHSPFIVPYSLSQQQQLQLEHHLATNNNSSNRAVSGSTGRGAQLALAQSNTSTPTAAKHENTGISNGMANDTSDKITTTTASGMNETQSVLNNGASASSSASENTSCSTLTEKSSKEDSSQALQESQGESAASSNTNSSSLPTTSSTTVSASQPRPIPGPFGHNGLGHPLQLSSTGPMGMSLPNLFTPPMQFVPFGQSGQTQPSQSSNAGSRRGSIASESGSLPGDPGHFPAYFLYPPVLGGPSGVHINHHPATNAPPASSAYICPRNNNGMPSSQFTNPPPNFPALYHQATSSNGASSANSRKNSTSMPSQGVTVHSVSPAQLFSIPPPLPVVSQKSGSATGTNNSNSNSLPITSSGVGAVPVPFITLNRDLHHTLAFPAAFIAPPHVDSFSPPPPGPASPSGSNNASASGSNGNIPAGNPGGFRGSESLRNHGPFSGHSGLPAGRRAPVTGFANVHYHQRINSQQGNGTHLHQSQSMGNMPSRPQPTVVRGSTVNCFRCGEPGHLQNQCTSGNRRRTPFSGREFHINPVPLPTTSAEVGSTAPADLRVPLSQLAQRAQQHPSAIADGLKSSVGPQQPKSVENTDGILPAVVVSSDSPSNPSAAAQ